MRILELFAGIGACSKALERIGIDVEIVDAVEIDRYAMASFNAIHGTDFEVQDIKEWDKDLKDIDLITHGSPCQDFSIAGRQAGGDLGSGTRSSLMYETIRIVGKIRPKYVLWENVKNILSKKHKHNFDSYIETMKVLGYNSYYQVLNAKDYGIPQNRERVYTVSIRKDIDSGYEFPETVDLETKVKDALEDKVDEKYYLKEKGLNYVSKRMGTYTQIIDESSEIARCPITAVGNTNWTGNFVLDKNNVGFKFPEPMELKLRLKDVLEDEVEEKYYLSEKMINFFYKNEQIQKEKGNGFRFGVSDGNVVAKSVTTRAGSRMDDNFIKIINATKKGYDEATDGDSVNLQYPNSKTRRGRVGHGVSQTLMANDSMGVVEGIKVIGNYMPSNHDASRIVDSNGLAPAVKENHGTVTAIVEKINKNAKHQQDLVQSQNDVCRVIPAGTHGSTPHLLKTIVNENPLRIRKLTPKECWRLMRL